MPRKVGICELQQSQPDQFPDSRTFKKFSQRPKKVGCQVWPGVDFLQYSSECADELHATLSHFPGSPHSSFLLFQKKGKTLWLYGELY